LKELKKYSACRGCSNKIIHTSSAIDRRNDALHGMLTTGMCQYFENKLNGIEGPVLFYSTDKVPRSGEPAITLQIFNVEKSIAESLLIQSIRTLLCDLEQNDYSIRVNSLGDKDSSSRYIRELTAFMRKRINDMPAPARELMKEHVFVSLMHLIDQKHELAEKSPNPLEYLTDSSRKHFREIIEYLDISNAPYEIDPQLIGHHECYSDAIFAVDVSSNNGESLFYIRGGRYNNFVSRMSKEEVAAAGAVIVLRNKKAIANIPKPREYKEPSAYIIQLGFGPKIKSLLLLSELKKANIPVLQNVVSDSLSDQLHEADKKNVRFAVIVGQKEYIEDKVILRDLKARNQTTIPVSKLAAALKQVT